jgi:hypothetical protein
MPVGGGPEGDLMMSPSSKNKRTRCHPNYQQAIASRKSPLRHYMLATKDPPSVTTIPVLGMEL